MAKPSPTRKSVPLHVQISEKLRAQIGNGKYPPGAQIPSEHQLMAQFNVSRITVRRAIANLVHQGLVDVQRGRGVFVKMQRKAVYSLSNPIVFFEDDLARQGFTNTIENLVFEAIAAPDYTCKQLQLAPNAKVYFQKKLLLIDAVPAALDVTYLQFELGCGYAEELKHAMTFPTLERGGTPIHRIDAVLESTHADTELSQYLEVPLGGPILVYRYVAYIEGDRPILYGETLSRGDRLSYAISLTK